MKLNLDKYKNIIFDLGGVIYNINYQLTINAFKDLGISNFDQLFSQAKQQQLFDRYEKGHITTIEFRKSINAMCGNQLSDKQIDGAWNALLLDLPASRLEVLSKVNKTHRIFLLSNTTELHIGAINDYLKENFNNNDLHPYFEKVYFSYEIGMRKPDTEIFQYVLNENALKAEETLFIDDSIQHIEGARKLEIQAYWLDITKESIETVFI